MYNILIINMLNIVFIEIRELPIGIHEFRFA